MMQGREQNAWHRDAWHIDPVTSAIKPVDDMPDPVVIVVEKVPALAITIAEVCDFLHIRVEQVASILEVGKMLHDIRPIAMLSEASDVDCTVYDLLMVIAGYDPGLPVLMVLNDQAMAPDDRLKTRRALDAAQRLWQLTEVSRFPQRPGIRDLIDFLFLAGRKSGADRLAAA